MKRALVLSANKVKLNDEIEALLILEVNNYGIAKVKAEQSARITFIDGNFEMVTDSKQA